MQKGTLFNQGLEWFERIIVCESFDLIINNVVLPIGFLCGFTLELAGFTLVLLAECFFISSLALHFSNEFIADIDLFFEVVRENVKDFIFTIGCAEGFFNLFLAVNLSLHLLGLFNFELLESLIPSDFSLSLSFSLSGFKFTVKFIIFLINLAFKLFVNLELRLLVLLKDVLEVLITT